MRAGVLWMVMVCLSDGEKTRCSVETIVTVSKLSQVSVSCPPIFSNSSTFEYRLLLNDSCIGLISLNTESESAESFFSGQFGVRADSTGVYVCKRAVIYPPPFRVDCHTTQVIVAEKQSFLPAINATVPAANQSCPVTSPLIPEVAMWAGCGVLLVYNLSITCIIVVVRRTSRREEEDTNIYANTRPGEPWKSSKV